MKLISFRDAVLHKTVYRLEITDIENAFMDLDPIDKAMVKECDSSNLISDKLLALECIVRRIEQTNPSPAPAALSDVPSPNPSSSTPTERKD